MGEIIVRKVKGMNWKAKIALVLMFTMVFSTFLHQGWYNPKPVQAALSSKQGTFVKNAAAGAQSITGLGFQPKAIIFYWTRQTATGYLASTSGGYGFAADGPPITMAAVSIQALDNQATTDANNYHSNAAAIVLQNTASGGALNNLGTVTAFGADGFTVNWSAAGTADIIHYIALGGTDITNAKVGTTSMFALTGNSSVTGVGFQPDTAFLLSSINGNILNTVTASLRTGLTFGFMSNTSGAMTQGSLSVGNRDARTAVGYIGGVWSNTNYTNLRATAADVVATWSSWDADGFTMNATAAPNGAHNVSWLALKGGKFKSGSLAQPAATGAQNITGVGFQPTAVMFASANLNSASGTVSTTTAKQSFGAAGTTQSGTWIGAAGTINSDENMYSSTTAAVTLSTGPTTTNAQASLSTLNADGFSLNWTTADATARNVLYIAMGSATPAGDTVNVADGSDPANYNVARGSANNVADSFTMVSTNTQDGAAAVTGVTASLTNSANISGIRLYKDNGVVGTYEAGTDTLLSTGTPGASVSFTGFTENLTTTASNYLILVDVASGATLAQTVVASVTGLTVTVPDSQGTITDTGSTLTIVDVPHENVGTGLNTAIATSPKTEGVAGVLMQRFQVTSSTSGAGAQDNQLELNSLGIDDLGTATGARTAKVYIDTTSSATLPGTAVLIGSVTSWTGTPTSITLNQGTAGDRTVTNATPRYIYIVYDLPAGATQTVQSSVTSVGVVSPDAGQTGLTLNSNVITLSADPSKIVSCSGCHGYGATFTDGTARNTPAGKFQGSHNTHVAAYGKACSVCHSVPATETSADFNHRSGTIQMASPINGNVGAAYSKGASWTQTNAAFSGGTCSNTYCHSNGTSATTPPGSIPANTSTTWGATTVCNSCHGTGADGRPNYVEPTPKANKHQSTTHAAQTCDVCHSSVTYSGGVYTPNTSHVDGAYSLNVGMGYTPGTAAGGGTCATPGCHSSVAWGGSLGCTDCHSSVQGTRAAVVGEFGLAWGHKKTGRGAVADADCIVCHLEGVYATQAQSATYHGNGNIDLRDPDGAGETPITNNSGGAFTFTQYAVSYTAGSRTSTLGNTVAEVITVKFCMKCHDANGATNTTARSNNGGTGTAFMPFGGVNLGATYTTANGAAAAGGLVNVATQFASTNSSRHPVGAANIRMYPYSTRLLDPYKPATTRDSNTQVLAGTGTRASASSIILVCDDCHTTGTTVTTRTITAHGNAASLRGTYYVAGPTLCLTCHITGSNGAYNNTTTTWPGGTHGVGSGFGTGPTRPAAAMNNCNVCHFSDNSASGPARPRKAQDIHGFNEIYGTAAGWTTGSANGMRPIAFMRSSAVASTGSWPTGFSPRPYTATLAGPGQFNLAAGQAQCGGSFAFGNTWSATCSNNGHTNYGPGGSY